MNEAARQDVLGRALEADEVRLLAAYETLKELLATDLAVRSPAVAANVKEAVSALWVAVDQLALTDDRPEV